MKPLSFWRLLTKAEKDAFAAAVGKEYTYVSNVLNGNIKRPSDAVLALFADESKGSLTFTGLKRIKYKGDK